MRNAAELFDAARGGMGGWTVERLDVERDFAALVAQLALYVALFLTNFRRMPTANAEDLRRSEGT